MRGERPQQVSVDHDLMLASKTTSAPRQPTTGAVRNLVQSQGLVFEEVAGSDGLIDFHEFVMSLPPNAAKKYSRPELREFFEVMDRDGEGSVDACEFFLFTLRHAARMVGQSLDMVFNRYDRDKTGHLDRLEFRSAMESMGFGHVAEDLFRMLDHDGSAEVSYRELDAVLGSRYRYTPQLKRFLDDLASEYQLAGAEPGHGRDLGGEGSKVARARGCFSLFDGSVENEDDYETFRLKLRSEWS